MPTSYPAIADALYRQGVPLPEIARRLTYKHAKSAHAAIWRYRRQHGLAPMTGRVGRPRTATVCGACDRAIVGHARRGLCGACASKRYRAAKEETGG